MAILEEVVWYLQICNTSSCFYQVSESWPMGLLFNQLSISKKFICKAERLDVSVDPDGLKRPMFAKVYYHRIWQ